ncbi:BACON domain-containing protein [Microbulbifer sp. TRSA002]|uniref:BACON domain-containing protein n=1 Tax=Microbulbifer sp. TRSA002 TaxID=3243382 RepID=UPI0040392381
MMFSLFSFFLLVGCGGSGGGSGDSGGFSLSTNSLKFEASWDEPDLPTKEVTVTSNSGSIYLSVSSSGDALSSAILSTNNSSKAKIKITPKAPSSFDESKIYYETITVTACSDNVCSTGTKAQKTIKVQTTITGGPSIIVDNSPITFSMNEVDTEAPSPKSFKVKWAGDSFSEWSAYINWNNYHLKPYRYASSAINSSEGLVTIIPYTGNPSEMIDGTTIITATAASGAVRRFQGPKVEIKVNPAISLDGDLNFTFDSKSKLEDLTRTLTLSTSTQRPVSWTLTAPYDPWIKLSKTEGTSTGNQTVTLTLDKESIDRLSMGDTKYYLELKVDDEMFDHFEFSNTQFYKSYTGLINMTLPQIRGFGPRATLPGTDTDILVRGRGFPEALVELNFGNTKLPVKEFRSENELLISSSGLAEGSYVPQLWFDTGIFERNQASLHITEALNPINAKYSFDSEINISAFTFSPANNALYIVSSGNTENDICTSTLQKITLDSTGLSASSVDLELCDVRQIATSFNGRDLILVEAGYTFFRYPMNDLESGQLTTIRHVNEETTSRLYELRLSADETATLVRESTLETKLIVIDLNPGQFIGHKFELDGYSRFIFEETDGSGFGLMNYNSRYDNFNDFYRVDSQLQTILLERSTFDLGNVASRSHRQAQASKDMTVIYARSDAGSYPIQYEFIYPYNNIRRPWNDYNDSFDRAFALKPDGSGFYADRNGVDIAEYTISGLGDSIGFSGTIIDTVNDEFNDELLLTPDGKQLFHISLGGMITLYDLDQY